MTAVSALAMRFVPGQLRRLKPLVVLVGPTAVGKSRVAVELAKRFETEIVTADSRQIYCGMDIGTDKPPVESRQGILHRLIDLVHPDQSFNTGLFRQHAVEAIDELYGAGKLPLVVGGTGLYVRTLLQGLCEAPPADSTVRAQLCEESQKQGLDRLYARLVEVDPVTASKLHPRDTSKVIRALEVYQLSGQPMSEFQRRHGFSDRPFTALVVGLDCDRAVLYRRIEERIDWQLANGLLEETRRLLAQGYRRETSAMKGLGYRQISAYLAGEYDWAEMVRLFKRDTRHFAKRQMTWFRKQPGIAWVMLPEQERTGVTADRVAKLVEEFVMAHGLADSGTDGAPERTQEIAPL
ncbi:MAG TPA: tRNA (adenosine(37)-N6)-dimethylallyltransferase MiaA [Nitrospira sp.]